MPEWNAHLELLTTLEARFRAQFAAIDAHTTDPGEQSQQDILTATVRQLQHGVRSADGLWYPEVLAPVIDKPGIAETRRKVERLRQERDECREFLNRWPTGAEIHKFRFTGPGKHVHDGRRLEAGDIVQLTSDQAHAWRDRFEPVSDGMPLTV